MGACAMPLIEEEATIATGAMPQDKASNEPVLLTLKEAELFCAVIKNATVKREDRKKKKKEGKEKPILLEKKYLYCQTELCKRGIPIEVQVHHVYKEGDERRIPYPTDLYFDKQFEAWAEDPSRTQEEIEERRKERKKPDPTLSVISEEEVNERLAKLPAIKEGNQSVFLPNPEKYVGNEIEYRLLILKAWLETEGLGTGCGNIRPHMDVPQNIADQMGIGPHLQYLHDSYPKLKPNILYKHLIDFTESPEHRYQNAVTSYNLSKHLEKKENKEKKRKRRSRTLRVARTLASGVAGCITM